MVLLVGDEGEDLWRGPGSMFWAEEKDFWHMTILALEISPGITILRGPLKSLIPRITGANGITEPRLSLSFYKAFGKITRITGDIPGYPFIKRP